MDDVRSFTRKSSMETPKQFFLPGDVVTIRQLLPNKPTMIVVKKVNKPINRISKSEDSYKSNFFEGILCR